jgi:hypothetical protein
MIFRLTGATDPILFRLKMTNILPVVLLSIAVWCAYSLQSVSAPASLRDFIPSLDQIREDAKKDPHTLPESELKFAAELGRRMEDAKSQDSAESLFTELKECVLDVNIKTSETVRTSCLSAALDLGDRFPTLKASADTLQSQAPPDVVNLLPPRR